MLAGSGLAACVRVIVVDPIFAEHVISAPKPATFSDEILFKTLFKALIEPCAAVESSSTLNQ